MKNGVTLSLYDISWSVQETALAGTDLAPAKYMAIATYRGSYSKNVVDGYTVTARYAGELKRAELASVIYTVSYLGTSIEPAAKPVPDKSFLARYWAIIVCAGLALFAMGAVAYYLLRKNVLIYTIREDEYSPVGKLKIHPSRPIVDMTGLTLGTTMTEPAEYAIMIRRQLAGTMAARSLPCAADRNTIIWWTSKAAVSGTLWVCRQINNKMGRQTNEHQSRAVHRVPHFRDRAQGPVNITFDDVFVVRGVKIIQGKDNLFVAMPDYRRRDGQFRDICHPLANEVRQAISAVALAAYEDALAAGEDDNA